MCHRLLRLPSPFFSAIAGSQSNGGLPYLSQRPKRTLSHGLCYLLLNQLLLHSLYWASHGLSSTPISCRGSAPEAQHYLEMSLHLFLGFPWPPYKWQLLPENRCLSRRASPTTQIYPGRQSSKARRWCALICFCLHAWPLPIKAPLAGAPHNNHALDDAASSYRPSDCWERLDRSRIR